MTMDDGFRLALKALKKCLDKNYDPERIDAAFVGVKDKKFTRLTKDKILSLSKK